MSFPVSVALLLAVTTAQNACQEPPCEPVLQQNTSIDSQSVCSELEFYVAAGLFSQEIKEDSNLCREAQQVYHQCYWCAENVTNDFCSFLDCSNLPEITDPTINVTETCLELEELFFNRQYPATTELCNRAEQVSRYCPYYCDYLSEYYDDDLSYLGADTTAKKKTLVWMSRAAAILSFIGACYILYNVLSSKKNRSNVYHQLLGCMSCFDICTAVAWSLASFPIPDEQDHVYGANGNEATCKAQAFFIQLGYTSVFYNVSLSFYYVLVICYSWGEHQLKKIRVWLHGIPLTIGIGLALGAIPEYGWIEYGCHFLPYPDGDLWTTVVFVVVPIGLSIVFITLFMLMVYCKVRRQARATRRWLLGVGRSGTLERDVFSQCFWYVMAFYVTWPIQFGVYLDSLDLRSYAVAVIMAFVAPLQGFNNFLVYVRPRIRRYRKNMKRERESRSSEGGRSFLLWRRGRTETTATESSSSQPESISSSGFVDPSAQLAVRNSTRVLGVEESDEEVDDAADYMDPPPRTNLEEENPDVLKTVDQEKEDDVGLARIVEETPHQYDSTDLAGTRG